MGFGSMEILEVLFVLSQACGCMAELAALGSNVGVGVAAVKVGKGRKAQRAAREAGEPVPANRGPVAALLVLVFFAVFFTGLVALKWLR